MKNELRLSVKPDIEKYKGRMEEIKHSIREILDTAMIDFLMVSSVFKKYNQFAEPSIAPVEAARISLSVKELQYMDIFGQKLNHIVLLQSLLHENKMIHPAENGQESIYVDHANFIFKLNHLQATIATHDFKTMVTDLKKNLHELHDHIIEVTRLEFQENDYFKHLDKIEGLLNALTIELGLMAKERIAEAPLHADVKHQGMKITSLYTMDSERHVLQWSLDNLTRQANDHDMKELCMRDLFGNGEPEIELF